MKTNFRRVVELLIVLPFLAVGFFAGCGGGSGSNAPPPQVSVAVSGTVAAGSAVAGADVIFKDTNGQQTTATTSANGQYSITTTGLTSPYLVKVTTSADMPGYPAGTVFYSVSADSSPSVVNVTPLTDLIVRTWYQLQPSPVTADVAFADPVANPPPEPSVVSVVEYVVRSLVGNALADNGVDWSAMNLISTPFVSNGAGMDAALGGISVDAASGSLSTATVSTAITAVNGNISSIASAVSASGVSGSTMPVPTNAQASALKGIQTLLDAFSATVNAKGTQLADTDILPYLDVSAMSGGLNRAYMAIEYADRFRAKSGEQFAVRLLSLDSQNGNVARISTSVEIVNGTDKFSIQGPQAEVIQQGNGQWLIRGDQQIAQAGATSLIRGDNDPLTPDFVGVNFHVNVLQDALGGTPFGSAVPAVNGPGAANLPMNSGGPRDSTFYAYPGAAATTFTHYTYGLDLAAASGVSGSTYTVRLPTSYGAVTYSYTVKGETTEMITITPPNAPVLGSAITVGWTLPTTFAVTGVQFEGTTVVKGSGGEVRKCDPVNSPYFLPASATSGTITLPGTCGDLLGDESLLGRVSVAIYGAGGETIRTGFEF